MLVYIQGKHTNRHPGGGPDCYTLGPAYTSDVAPATATVGAARKRSQATSNRKEQLYASIHALMAPLFDLNITETSNREDARHTVARKGQISRVNVYDRERGMPEIVHHCPVRCNPWILVHCTNGNSVIPTLLQ